MSLFANNQSKTLLHSFFMTVRQLFRLSDLYVVVESSAYCRKCKILELFFISFTYSKNNQGPRIEPCGTPIFTLLVGDLYPFVLKKYWFANAYAVPSAGIDYYTTKNARPSGSTKSTYTQSFLALNYGFGGGYNGDKIFFGGEIKNRLTNEKLTSETITVTPAQNHFSVYFGYRFKAPKPITAPVDYMEDKVPLLKDEPKN